MVYRVCGMYVHMCMCALTHTHNTCTYNTPIYTYVCIYICAIYTQTYAQIGFSPIPPLFSLSMEFVTNSKEMSKRVPSPYPLSRCVHLYVEHNT